MHDTYETPLNSRYASREMQKIFSPDRKFTTWRKLWVALAESEMEMGLPVTQKQVDELKAHVEDIDYEAARRHEERTRHDVMAHVPVSYTHLRNTTASPASLHGSSIPPRPRNGGSRNRIAMWAV